MIFWKTKLGEELTFSQFIKKWKEGINKAIIDVTPIQRLESNIFFVKTMILGFFLGLCVSLYNNTWWLAIILFGGLGLNIIQYKTFKQQLNIFKQIEEQVKKKQKWE